MSGDERARAEPAGARERELPPEAWLVALAALPDVGPARLAALLELRAPESTFADLASGSVRATPALAAACGRDPAGLLVRWRAFAADLDVVAHWAEHVDAGVRVLLPDDPSWPARLRDDPDPPALLFVRSGAGGGVGVGGTGVRVGGGVLGAAAGPTAAIVGTRRCTQYGLDTAHELGAGLTRAGVAVVSGLAAGIDGAAHRGALDALDTSRGAGGHAPPVGVVGTGLDVPYPRGHERLWQRVAAAGVLLSEAPLRTRPARWRFPARNRIIAGLADVVVVVESAQRGGAMHTVDEALRRDRPVLAVPGPVQSEASSGTNRLLRDVAAPCCDLGDVLLALGLDPGDDGFVGDGGGGGASGSSGAGPRSPFGSRDDHRPAPTSTAASVLSALGWLPATVDSLVSRTGLDLGPTALALAELVAGGWVVTEGPWYQRARAGQEVRDR